ncbi:MAG: serine/threonine-protein kinase [Planctomycetota bacterium]
MHAETHGSEGAGDDAGDEVLRLVTEALEQLEAGGDAALAAYVAGLSAHRAHVERRLAALRSAGLIGPTEPEPLGLPEVLGDFRLVEPLGSGGMGVVYRGVQLSLGREVAIKLVRPEQVHLPGARERFLREIQIIAKLGHEGIVRLYDSGEVRGVPWFAMELVHGASLADVLHAHLGRAPHELQGAEFIRLLPEGQRAHANEAFFAGSWVEVALRLVERAALALEEAHRIGVLHRDLKPSNIMYTASGRVVLLDFGLAWTAEMGRLTRSSAQLGTAHYMAPEQFEGSGRTYDERTDVYALGVVLRELVTLRSAFNGATLAAIARQVLDGRPAPFQRNVGERVPGLEVVIGVAMERDRARRYATARSFARDLRALVEGAPIAARPPSLTLRLRRIARRYRALSGGLAAAGALLAILPFLVAWRERELRLDLEAANVELAAEVRRADGNFGLAADALSRTLERVDREDLAGIPDLLGFSEGVLRDTDEVLSALMVSNPSDPSTRLRVAEALLTAGRVRWQYRDIERAQAAHRRVTALVDGCDADPERVDRVDLVARLGLVYLDRLDPRAAAAAYREARERVLAHGAIEGRTLELRGLFARALAREGAARVDLGEAEAFALLEAAQSQREALLTSQESVELRGELILTYDELARGLAGIGEHERAAQHERAAEAALGAALRLAPESAAERAELAELAMVLGSRARRKERWDEAIASFEGAASHWWWVVERRGTRLTGYRGWAHSEASRAECYLQRGERAQAIEIYKHTLEELAPLLSLWRNDAKSNVLVLGLRLGLGRILEGTPEDRQALREVLDAALVQVNWVRAQGLRGAVLADACCDVLRERAELELAEGRPLAALAELEGAEEHIASAMAQAAEEHVGLGDQATTVACVRAEALLQLARVDEACATLTALRRLPADLHARVPSLAAHASDPRLAAVWAKL